MKKKIIVVGGGSAGLIAAITVINICNDVEVTIIRSSEIGHIMVGEGTFDSTPYYFHEVLEISREEFYTNVKPTWKLGARFLWGKRPYFDYTFTAQITEQNFPNSHSPLGHYFLHNDWQGISKVSECMSQNTLPCSKAGMMEKDLPRHAAYHFENQAFVDYLEKHFLQLGGDIIDAKVISAQTGERGIDSIKLDSGAEYVADFFVDASGFRGELIHKSLGEPYISMRDHLFCDRAIVGGWERRENEPIKPYTTAETMDAGWCWQIEHERIINRGYVHCSAFISEEQAIDEFRRKNPLVKEVRTVPFETRRIRTPWVKNVVAIGNACGFVEPLEATNIQVICNQSSIFANSMNAGGPDNETVVKNYNHLVEQEWLNIRDFLALHYRFNNRLDTPFWTMAVNETPLGGLQEFVDFYQKSGPNSLGYSLLPKVDKFSQEGCLVMLLGMKVPWAGSDQCRNLSEEEQTILKFFRNGNTLFAMQGPNSEEMLAKIRSQGWQWKAR